MAQLVLIFTDLDGCLLDHDTYSFDKARPALDRLASDQFPVIPASSKTATEVITLNQALGRAAPFIFENGSGIGVPCGMFPGLDGTLRVQSFELKLFGRSYSDIVDLLHAFRDRFGYRFEGFSDWSAQGVAARTALPIAQAVAAQQRLGSEPIVWNDSEAAFSKFLENLAEQNLLAVRGGRFVSIQDRTSKASAMHALAQLYRRRHEKTVKTIAIGDSANDREMLNTADVAIVIRNRSGGHLTVNDNHPVYRADRPGPAGWREGIDWLYETILQ